MFYREVGQFKTNYAADQQVFPVKQDQIAIVIMLLVAFFVFPFTLNDFWFEVILTPFLIYALAAIGLNIVTGYTGLLSLGTGGFMGVGAYAAYKLTTIFPEANIILVILMSGFFSAGVGIIFGLPSLRIKGFYLAVATLAAQFFLEWAFIRIGWLYNYNPSGAIEVPNRDVLGITVVGPNAEGVTKYLVTLSIVVALAWVANNVLRGKIGRTWMAIRDMDIAAELIGIRLLPNKLLSFAFSSYYCGVAGAMLVFLWLGSAEVESFDITNASFFILFMVIIGGLGSLAGSFIGAAFIVILPIIIRTVPPYIGLEIGAATVEHLQLMIVGALIIFFLIVEPEGLAKLWSIARQKLRTWPFPY